MTTWDDCREAFDPHSKEAMEGLWIQRSVYALNLSAGIAKTKYIYVV